MPSNSLRPHPIATLKVSVAAGLLTVLLVSGLGSAVPLAHAQPAVIVTILNGAGTSPSAAPGYSPDSVTVVIGVNNTVTWTDNDELHHSVYSSTIPAGASAFHSLELAPGDNFTQTFTVAGTYYYYCNQHSWMTGTVIVKAASSPVPEFPVAYLAANLFAVIVAAIVAAPRLRPSPKARASRPSTTLIKGRHVDSPV